jgi:hypothetical protein
MKTTIDGCEVYSRVYYYLLDFNEYDNWKYISEKFNKEKLRDLTGDEIRQLFEYATQKDLENNLNKFDDE